MRSRASREDGFGLIELLISMVVLNVGILALIAAFQSGAFALQRAGKLSSAAAIADIQMERYRGLTYSAITLDTATFGTDMLNSVHVLVTCAWSKASSERLSCCGSPEIVVAARTSWLGNELEFSA